MQSPSPLSARRQVLFIRLMSLIAMARKPEFRGIHVPLDPSSRKARFHPIPRDFLPVDTVPFVHPKKYAVSSRPNSRTAAAVGGVGSKEKTSDFSWKKITSGLLPYGILHAADVNVRLYLFFSTLSLSFVAAVGDRERGRESGGQGETYSSVR